MGEPLAVYRDILAAHGYRVDLPAIDQALSVARQTAAAAVPAGPLPDQRINAEREYARREYMVCQMLERLGVNRNFEACRLAIWDSWLGTGVFHQFPEVRSVLARLKGKGYILAAISNWEPRLDILCANHGIRDYFDFILASEAEGFVKPGSFLFEKALRLARVEAHEAFHVGDSYPEDVQPARALGMAAVLVVRDGEGNSPVDYSPTIRSLEQLFPLLQAEEWIQGRVVSGVGEAAGFTELPWVREQTSARLGFTPYPGTLNLFLESCSDQQALQRLKSQPGIVLAPEPGYCAARCFPVAVEGHGPAAAVVPEVTGYPQDKLEILSPTRLRDELSLADGRLVTVAVAAGSG